MASAVTKISTVTADGSSSAMEFTGIVGTYEDLIVKVEVRSGRASGAIQDSMLLRFNSVSAGGSYAYQTMYSDTGAAQGDLSASATYIQAGYVPTTNNTSNVFSNGEIYISDYSDTTHYKAVKSDIVDATDSNAGYLFLGAGTFLSNSAITSLSLLTGSGQNWVTGSTATLYGVTKFVGGTGSKAIGGTVTTGGGYTYHTFLTSGNFTPTASITGAEVLVVAGGGGSGNGACGGGGAGGLVYASSQSYSSGTNYAAVVGAGGKHLGDSNGANGSPSVFAAGTVAVGGGGGGYPAGGNAGGSGGGAHREGGGGAGTAGQGNAGANGTSAGGSNAGGGGGAGEAGQVVNSSGQGGGGGKGSNAYSAWATATGTGQAGYYAGGGGGRSTTGAVGGLGGGGSGLGGSSPLANGRPNTGGGGGGASESALYGNGGSGIIIVRYTT
jgi:hypothetical protein